MKNKRDKIFKPNMKVLKKDSSSVKDNFIEFYKNLTPQSKMIPKMMFTFHKFTKRFFVRLMPLTKKPGNFLMTGILNFIALWKEGLIF